MQKLLRQAAELIARGRKAQSRGLYAHAFGWYNQAIGILKSIDTLHAQGQLDVSEEWQVRIAAMQDSLAMMLERLAMKERNGGRRLSGQKSSDSIAEAAATMLEDLGQLWQ